MSRQFTTDEISDQFLDHVRGLCDYWHGVHKDGKSAEDCIRGAVFSVLSALDGSVVSLPAFIVAPMPHKDDKAYNVARNENFYPENKSEMVTGDIGGSLHERFYKKG